MSMLTLENKDKRIANKSRRRIFTGPDLERALFATSLGDLGWTTEAIKSATESQFGAKYTTGMVQNRLKFAGVWRASWTRDEKGKKIFHPTFRNGQSKTAVMVAERFGPKIESRILSIVQSKLNPDQRQRFASEG